MKAPILEFPRPRELHIRTRKKHHQFTKPAHLSPLSDLYFTCYLQPRRIRRQFQWFEIGMESLPHEMAWICSTSAIERTGRRAARTAFCLPAGWRR
jgi:hypothetical protein